MAREPKRHFRLPEYRDYTACGRRLPGSRRRPMIAVNEVSDTTCRKCLASPEAVAKAHQEARP